jgi:LPS-assembly lipoprotein
MRAFATLALMAALAGCGLQPLYATQGPAAQTTAVQLAGVSVDPIPERLGQLVRTGLLDRMGTGTETHRLSVALTQRTERLGIRSDESATRERVILQATYALRDGASGAVVTQGQIIRDVGVDRVRSEYATVVAEEAAYERLTALIVDEITLRLALHFRGPAK